MLSLAVFVPVLTTISLLLLRQPGALTMRRLLNIFWLGTKELRSFSHDYVLLGLVVYTFSFAIYAQASSTSQELHNAAIAIVDEDRSQLSQRNRPRRSCRPISSRRW